MPNNFWIKLKMTARTALITVTATPDVAKEVKKVAETWPVWDSNTHVCDPPGTCIYHTEINIHHRLIYTDRSRARQKYVCNP